jgi:hypothetical protein
MFLIRFVYNSVRNISKQCHSGIASFAKIGAVENILYLRGSMKLRTYLPDFTTDFGIIAKENANNNLLVTVVSFMKIGTV